MSGRRIPPHSVEAEVAVLGAALLGRDGLAAVLAVGLRPGDFYKPAHQSVYDAVVALAERGEPVDAVTVLDELRRGEVLDDVDVVELLAGLERGTPSIAAATKYGAIVKHASACRQVVELGGRVTQVGYDEPRDLAAAVASVAERLAAVDGPGAASSGFVDLAPYLDGTHDEPTPRVLVRTDGRALLYPGRNWLHGDSGDGKSLVAAIAAADEVRQGRHVVWLDAEEASPATLAARLLALGLSADQIVERIHYRNVRDEPYGDTLAALRASVNGLAPRLAVLDSFGESLATMSGDENADQDCASWVRQMLDPLSAILVDAAILVIDHATKAKDNPLYPSGSKRKRAAVTGIALATKVLTPFRRDQRGAVALLCGKDRHGHYGRGETVAVVVLDSHQGGTWLDAVVAPPKDHEQPAVADREHPLWKVTAAAVQAVKGSTTPLSLNELLARMIGVRARRELKYAGIDAAVRVGAITVTRGGRGARLHSFARALTDDDVTEVCGPDEGAP
jgi:hypothetical protein